MNSLSREILLFTVSVLTLSCTDSINPSGEFKTHMVVYSVLSSASDTQYVRIYTNYDSPNHLPQENMEELSVADAAVTVSDGTNSFPFHYKTIPRSDTSRYKSPIGLYLAYPFRPQANKEYTLTVSSPSLGQGSSKTTVPGKGYVNCPYVAELSDRGYSGSILVYYSLNSSARAFVVRFFVTYTTENPGDIGSEHYVEVRLVPLFGGLTDPKTGLIKWITPSVVSSSAVVFISSGALKSIEYAFPAYPETLKDIVSNNSTVRFKRAVFYLAQFNEPWYKYYASSNLAQDKYGLRIDSPYFSNIESGSGLFGAMCVDSVVIAIPEKLVPGQ